MVAFLLEQSMKLRTLHHPKKSMVHRSNWCHPFNLAVAGKLLIVDFQVGNGHRTLSKLRGGLKSAKLRRSVMDEGSYIRSPYTALAYDQLKQFYQSCRWLNELNVLTWTPGFNIHISVSKPYGLVSFNRSRVKPC